jgi:uncharacterized protein involved in type VI secretion and phage assembly
MTDYRLYFREGSGRFVGVQELDCADDAAAIEMAEQMRRGATAELWQRGRQVRAFDGVVLWPNPASAADPLASA